MIAHLKTKSYIRLTNNMSKADFIAAVCSNMNTTENELNEIGLIVLPCLCRDSDFCPGWTLEKDPTNFSFDKFNAMFS